MQSGKYIFSVSPFCTLSTEEIYHSTLWGQCQKLVTHNSNVEVGQKCT